MLLKVSKLRIGLVLNLIMPVHHWGVYVAPVRWSKNHPDLVGCAHELVNEFFLLRHGKHLQNERPDR